MMIRRVLVVLLAVVPVLASPALPALLGFSEAAIYEEDEKDPLYERGRRALDAREWQDALDAFDGIIERKGDRVDAALYWRAYALNKLGRRSDALAALAELRRAHASSRWLSDAKALEVEVRQAAGQPVRPEGEDDEEIKLVALGALVNTEPERALPILEKMLQSTQSPKVRGRALFVLTQSGSPQARAIVARIARGETAPDLQRNAIQNLGIFGGAESRQVLAEVYENTKDVGIKKAILHSLMISRDQARVLKAARSEKDPELRKAAIHLLGVMGAHDALWDMYQAEPTPENRKAVIKALMVGGAAERLIELSRTEKDPDLRGAIIQAMGISGPRTGDALLEMYRNASDEETKGQILHALFLQGNAKVLVELARKEKDPQVKKRIVHWLSLMRSKEATDYLVELLGK